MSRARVGGWLVVALGMASLAHAQSSIPGSNCPYEAGRPDGDPAPASMPWMDPALPADQRVELIFSELSLLNKLDLATGEYCGLYGFFNAPIPRLGIPALTMADGPAGVRIANIEVNGGLSTALPAPIALGATFDRSMATMYGDVLGKEAIVSGHNVQLGPTLDTPRVAKGGRGFETFGEDPFLRSEMAVPYVEAIQAHPVIANAKHVAMYAQESERLDGIDVIVDERTMREIYLPPFEAAVREANVGSAMCSFHKVNGVFQCEDASILVDIVKNEYGLRGFVMSDYGATHSTTPSALGGLDQEQPYGIYYAENLYDAVATGDVPMDVLDEIARRVLWPMFEYKLFDEPAEIGVLPIEEDGAIARSIAEQSIVLLKNMDNALPLAAETLTSIAVIGADATNTTAQGGGSAQVDSVYSVSPLDGVRSAAGAATVSFVEGTDPVTAAHVRVGGENAVPSSVLTPTNGAPGSHGLSASYYTNTDFSGEPATTGVERQVAVSLGFMAYGLTPSSVPIIAPPEVTSAFFSARWTGTLTPPASGTYTFTLTARGRGGVYINGTAVVDDTVTDPMSSTSGTIELTAGTAYDIRVDYIADDPSIGTSNYGGEALLSWTMPEGAVTPDIAAAAEAAKAANVAIVFVRDFETESLDRSSLSLPNSQDRLIQNVVAANPRTIVVLQTGGPVTMPWIDSVPAVLEAWYGGQEQGNAIASVLFGTVNPSGKLPVTFPRAENEVPASDASQYPGVNKVVTYSEGVNVGYRWYDRFAVEPLFPFGFGLSYTTFQYTDLQVTPGTGATPAEAPVNVKFTVTNTGARAGAEVAQVYVGTLPGTVETPLRQLAGFEKVTLEPGASASVEIAIDPRSLSYWDEGTHAWVRPSGAVSIHVGSSSRDIRLTDAGQALGARRRVTALR